MKKFFYYATIIILIGVMLFSGYNIFKIQKEYSDGKKTYEELEKSSPKTKDDKDLPKKSQKSPNNIPNHEQLKAINDDYVGWLYIPNTGIDYPVVHTDNNDYYLHHTFYHEYNKAGTIFISSNSNPDLKDSNTIIHGHNLLNGTMFSGLTNYQNTDFFNANPYAYIYTKDKTFVYQVMSAFVCTVNSPVYTTVFDNDLIAKIRGFSMVASKIKATEKNKFVTFSTCTNWQEDERFVVVMKKI